MKNQAIPLGKEVSYSQTLDRDQLAPVERESYRSLIEKPVENMTGEDVWNCFEVNCLDPNRIPRTFWLEFSIPASSLAIPESKSLKLYLGSMFNHQFQSKSDLSKEIESALEAICGEKPSYINLFEPSSWSNALHADKNVLTIDSLVNPEKRKVECQENRLSEILAFHSFRAVCPVTSQPDYASVVVSYSGTQVTPDSLASYLFSKRLSSGFHEYWAEQIFSEVFQAGDFGSLKIQLFFARRGGIAINPFRQTPGFYLSTPAPSFSR